MRMSLNYPMEEIVPVTARLAECYTGYESTSVTYETAQRLMGAVLYCINEQQIAVQTELTAQQAYEAGFQLVKEKAECLRRLYNELILEFCDYGNECLRDTIVEGIPAFFREYDIKYAPQDTILTLDYPVFCDLSSYTGIDAVFLYVKCIAQEQKFLKNFSQEHVREVLCRYHTEYELMIENICGVILAYAVENILKKSELTGLSRKEWKIKVREAIRRLAHQMYPGDEELSRYLLEEADNIAVRMEVRQNIREE